MPRILAPNQSIQRRGSQHSLSSRASRSSRTSLHNEPQRRGSLPSRGYQNAAYESAFSLRRIDASRRQSLDPYNGHSINGTQQNAQWELQDPRKTLSKESLNTCASTQSSSQSSSISTLPSVKGTSASGLAAAFALLMKQKTGSGVAPNTRPELQSVPSSPNPPSTLASSFDPACMIKEEPDCWGQFVDVQSVTEDLEKRSRVIRRYPGAPQSLPRGADDQAK